MFYFAARDRIGKKPFYYWHKNQALVFGSEIKAILQDPEMLREVNHTSGKANNGARIWSLLFLELWHRMFIDSY